MRPCRASGVARARRWLSPPLPQLPDKSVVLSVGVTWMRSESERDLECCCLHVIPFVPHAYEIATWVIIAAIEHAHPWPIQMYGDGWAAAKVADAVNALGIRTYYQNTIFRQPCALP